MRHYIHLTLVGLLLSACAHTPSPNKTATEPIAQTAPVKDIERFRVSDFAGPEVKSEELEQIPTEMNAMVDKWIRYFQGRGRGHMERYLARSARYEKLMKKVLRDNKLPEDLFYIALIESGFSSQAISHASAVGYWQFIRGTGKRYGLEINQLVDERRDPVLATEAAADYFKTLYEMTGSWNLSMAAYNVGEGRVLRVTKRYGTKNFWELTKKRRALPRETANYIPKFMAAKLIAQNPDQYGFDGIDYMEPIEFDNIAVRKPVNLRVMAEKLNINYEDFKDLNPKYKGEVAPLKNGELHVRIPPGMGEAALIAANDSAVEQVEFIADADTQLYKVRRGDNLRNIARKFRTTVAYLRELNDFPRKKSLKVGSMIYVPDRTPLKERSARPMKQQASNVKPKLRFHVVQAGESLFSIAQRYGTSVEELKKVNNIRRGRTVKVGVKLKIPSDDQRAEVDSHNEGRRANSKENQLNIVNASDNVKI